MIAFCSQFSQSLTGLLAVCFNKLTFLPWMIAFCNQFSQLLAGLLAVCFTKLTLLPWMIAFCNQFSQSLTGLLAVCSNELTLLPWMIAFCNQFSPSLTGTSIPLLGTFFEQLKRQRTNYYFFNDVPGFGTFIQKTKIGSNIGVNITPHQKPRIRQL